MIDTEIDEMKEFLENNRFLDAIELIKYTYNMLYPMQGIASAQEMVITEARMDAMEAYQNVAHELNFRFELEFADGKVTCVKWYHNDKWIRPINGFIKPILPEKNLRKRRSPIPAALRHEVYLRDGYRCVECGATHKERMLEVDHIIPVSRGGTDELDNLQTLCITCNRGKSDRIWRGPQ